MNFSMTMSLMKVVVVAFISFFVFISAEAGVTADTSCTATNNEYAIVGVSGGLQGGFPERFRMDYRSGYENEVKAKFLGKALVRGYRSYLDVMQKDWRQYTPEPDPNVLINCNVMPTGCYEHGNVYWIYAVDSRQFVTILFNEPRFLSITPDLGLIDLNANETSPLVQYIANHEINKQNKTDHSHVAFPIVTGAWYNADSHVPSPVLYTKEDGTQVTNFAESLATWVGIDIDTNIAADNGKNDDDHHHDHDHDHDHNTSCATTAESESFDFLEPGMKSELFFDAVRKKVRYAEVHPRSSDEKKADSPGLTIANNNCQKGKARFGVSKDMARINYPFLSTKIESILNDYYLSTNN